MKTVSKLMLFACGAVSTVCGLNSCTADSPFETVGEGRVHLNVALSTKTTRAEGDETVKYTPQWLLDNATFVLSDQDKPLYNWNAEHPMPSSINLRYGSYAADVWSGDSVPASFDAKFFRGRKEFEVSAPTANVSVECRLANTIVSVDEETIDSKYVRNVSIAVSNGSGAEDGTLVFNADNFNDKGYYMLSSDETHQYLEYTVTAENVSGDPITKTGRIENAKRSYEYRLKLKYSPADTNNGGAFVQIVVDDQVIEDGEDFEFLGRPVFSWLDNHDVNKQIIGTKGDFETQTLRVACWDSFSKLTFSTADSRVEALLPSASFDILEMGVNTLSDLKDKGIDFKKAENPEPGQEKYFVYFTDKWLNSLPSSETELVLEVIATDIHGKSTTCRVAVANTEAAIVYADPIIVDAATAKHGQLAIVNGKAEIPVVIDNADVENPGVAYREVGTEEWNYVDVPVTRANVSYVSLPLQSGKEYEYKLVWGADRDKESEMFTIFAETKFMIPNASMEDWSDWADNSKVLIPGANGERDFWDSGNHGSATMSKMITNPTTDIFHNGAKAAELKSQFVGVGTIGKFAAGNIFAGEYKETVGTDGKLSFGRPYNGTHPSALNVWVNYRPGVGVNKKGANDAYIGVGQTDKAQIYVALTSEPVEIFTKSGAEQKLFNPDDACVLAYGQATLEANYGAEGKLELLNIPIKYKADDYKTTKPTHLVIVCSASKFGDFFSGGEGSTLIVDDFELMY